MLFLIIVICIALYFSTTDEKRRAARAAIDAVLQAAHVIKRYAPTRGPFDEALRARTPLLIVTPAILAVNVVVFVGAMLAPGSIGDQATLVSWGANFGPETANGEWWRFAAAVFVHGAFFAFVIDMLAIGQLGPLLERQMGHWTFAALYLAAGTFGGLMNLAVLPEVATTSGAAAVCGLYGLLGAAIVRGLLRRSAMTLPFKTLIRLAPGAALFLLYNLSGGELPLAEKAGLFTGFIGGLVVAKDVQARKPAPARLAAIAAAALIIVAMVALPLRGVTDIRPELAFLVDLEARTTAAYGRAVANFRAGRDTTHSLAQVIDASILPELGTARARLQTLRRVPAAHQPFVAAAREYVRLRDQSWRLRLQALGKSNMRLLREADAAERASLAAFEQIRAGVATRAPGDTPPSAP